MYVCVYAVLFVLMRNSGRLLNYIHMCQLPVGVCVFVRVYLRLLNNLHVCNLPIYNYC